MSSVPAVMHRAITPSNTVNLPDGKCRSLYVGVSGDISVTLGGVTLVYKAVSGLLPVNADRVNVTSTTATDIIALY